MKVRGFGLNDFRVFVVGSSVRQRRGNFRLQELSKKNRSPAY